MSIFTAAPATWTNDTPVPNAATFNLEIKDKFNNIDAKFPTGLICMWSGSIATIPTGWFLCNGANGTPDLRDRFIVGAGSTYAVNATGGEATHTLTTPEMPAHTHTENGHYDYMLPEPSYTNNVGASAAGTTGSTGGGGAHENRPPYFSLAFIQKS